MSLSALHDATPLNITESLRGSHYEESSTLRPFEWVPVLFPRRTHSVVLTCRWRDQGYGNRKGKLFVVAFPSNDDVRKAAMESIENGMIVYESPLASH